jgi:hypothetical protein
MLRHKPESTRIEIASKRTVDVGLYELGVFILRHPEQDPDADPGNPDLSSRRNP